MDFRFTADEDVFREEIQSFLKQELPKNWAGGDWISEDDDERRKDGELSLSRTIRSKLARKGWLTLAWPSEYGGMDAGGAGAI